MVNGKWLVVSFWKTTKNFAFYSKIFIILVFLAFGLFACTEQKPSRDGIVIADSKKYEASIYRQNCAICHGAEAFGKTIDGKPIPSLRFGDAAKKSKAEIYSQISHGKLPMPAFKEQLTEREIQMMVDFIMYDLQDRKRENPK
ncbi:MAG: c-type cytochrome [Aridibacter sp.]